MKNRSGGIILAVALAALPAWAWPGDGRLAQASEGGEQPDAEEMRALDGISRQASERALGRTGEPAGAAKAPAPQPPARSEEPLPEPEAPAPREQSHAAQTQAAPKKAPRIAVIYVSPKLSEREELFTVERRAQERSTLESQGYLVLEREATTDNILQDLWDGVKAMAFFGHGGYKDQNGRTLPTFAGFDAQTWKNTVFVDFLKRYQDEMGLPFEEAKRRAAEKSENFGLETARNYSCFGLYDHSLAQRLVKPGGSYFGAKRWMTTSPVGEAIADATARCTPDGFCDCVGKISATHLTEYRVPDKPSEGVGISQGACAARAGHLARALKDWSSEGRRAVYDPEGFWKGLPGEKLNSLTQYLTVEDGAVKPIRTGRELAFYETLKERLASHPEGDSIGMDALLKIGLDSSLKPDGTANIQEAFLTVHNVMRLLARPQQWSGGPIKGDYGHPPSDPATPILEDLRGARPAGGKSLPEIMGMRKRDDGTVYDPNWSLRKLFDVEGGPFQAQPGAVNAEWNGGSHYYYWIGALGRTTLGAAGVMGGAFGEMRAKNAQGREEQGAVELSQFVCGSMLGSEIFKERQAFAPPGPEQPAPQQAQACEGLNPEGKGLEKGQYYAALRRYLKCLKGEESQETGPPAPEQPATPDELKRQCVECVNKLISGDCYVRVATLAGWGLCLTCSKDGGVAPENRFVEKNKCPACSNPKVSWSLCDFKPAPKGCVVTCNDPEGSFCGRAKPGKKDQR